MYWVVPGPCRLERTEMTEDSLSSEAGSGGCRWDEAATPTSWGP